MRIGIDATIISSMRNGVGVYAESLIREFSRGKSGHEFVVFVQTPKARELNEKYGAYCEIVAASGPDKGARLWFEQRRLPGLIRHYGIDLLHSVNMTAPIFHGKARSVVTVLDLTTFLFPQMRQPTYRFYMRTLVAASLKRADRLISISQNTTRDVERVFGIAESKIDTIALAFDPSVHRVNDPKNIAAVLASYNIRSPYLLFVGRLDKCKNLPRLIEDFARLRKTSAFAGSLVLAGRPWNDSAAIDQIIKDLNVGDSVRVTGHVADEDIAALYSGALGFVFPSIAEGFGIPLLEAMACEVPVLTSNASVLPEVAGDAALYADPLSVDDITAKLQTLVADENLRDDLIVRGKKQLTAYSWEKMARQTIESYLRCFP